MCGIFLQQTGFSRLTGCFVLALLCGWAASSEAAAAAQGTALSEEQIVSWVRDLDNDRFAIRERATQQLLQVGERAVAPLAQAMADGSLEARVRAKNVLMTYFESENQQLKAKVKIELAKLIKGNNPEVADWADGLLAQGETFTIKGQLTQTDPFDRFRRGSHCKIYERKLVAGRTYLIDLQGQFDTYIRVEDTAGRNLAMDDDGGEGLNSRLLFHPNQTGNYRIIVTSFGGNTFGPFTLTVARQK